MESLRAQDPPQVGTYRLLGRLGAGGMGEVFLGESPGGRKVAVKLVKTEHAQDTLFRQRFAREVAAARMVGGFHTAPVVDADPEGNPPWLVTAYIPGPSLAQLVHTTGPLDPEAVRRLGAALTEGLAAIHACGLVHRDLKPANIILAEDGPRIIDFGLVRAAAGADTVTETGTVVGTVLFMSPEQIGGARVDARSDVFSLGSVLAYAATGHSPFEADTLALAAARIAGGPPTLDGIEGPLRATIEACLTKDPAARPALDAVAAQFAGTARQDTYVPTLPEPTPLAPERIDPAAPVPTLSAAPQHASPGPAPWTPPAAPWTPPAAPWTPPAAGQPPRKRRTIAAVSAAALIVAAAAGAGTYLATSGSSARHPSASGPASAPAASSLAPSAPTPSAPTPSAPTPSASATVPSSFFGSWTGTLHSDTGGARVQQPELAITGGQVGDVVGRAQAPHAGCEYALWLVSARASEVVLHEIVQSATGGRCPPRYAILTPAPDGGLQDNVYTTLPARGETPRATGLLSRT